MWKEPEATEEYERRVARYQKDRPDELAAVLLNLAKYVEALVNGVKPLQIKFGFLHPEGMGVVAIDQKGGKGKGRLAQTRLYVYPDTDTETLYLITLGDKNSQRADVRTSHQFVESLRKAKGAEADQDPPEEG